MKRFWLLGIVIFVFLIGCTEGEPTPTPADPTPTNSPADPAAEVTSDSENLAPTAVRPAANANGLPYQDPDLPIDERVEDLLSRMSLEEKIGQMTLVEKDSILPVAVTRSNIGSILSGGGGSPPDNSPAGWLDMVTEFQQAALDTDLQIPLLYGVDAVHGHNNVVGATIFPHNIGLGATRNPELVQAVARATALETLATGIHWDYAPVLAVPQDIRWGRTYEGFAENTDLVTELSVAYLLGLQSTGNSSDLSDPLTLLGTPKHFVGDGGTVWGSSTTGSYSIDQGVTEVDEATLREIHLPPYPAAIDAGAMSMMASYSSWGGMKMHAQKYLMTDVLKGELGFEGFIVSDWEAIDQIDPNLTLSVITAINAGIDLNMVPYNYTEFIRIMTKAVRDGEIPLERVDDAVRRILRVKFELGLFENPFGDPALLEIVGSAEHRDLAREAVRESLVLLQNRDGVLPLEKGTGTIFVSGIGADDLSMQSGGWTIDWQGIGSETTPGTTVLEGITEIAGSDSEIVYDRFGKFARETDADGTPKQADVGIVVVGERPYAEGRGDSDDLSINATLVERMAERADKVVVIILSGRPMMISDTLPAADAWVAAWLPGTEGDGVAQVLFGDYPFTGKLSFSWPRSIEQLPFDFKNLPEQGCDAPLFEYGYGLSVADTDAVEIIDCS
ncbi:MAG: glycoside hydrolase family 3 protein [Anaerolineae bacterium]